jgi:hypothetical protein
LIFFEEATLALRNHEHGILHHKYSLFPVKLPTSNYGNSPTRASAMFPSRRTLFNWTTTHTTYQRPNSLHHIATPLPNAVARIR